MHLRMVIWGRRSLARWHLTRAGAAALTGSKHRIDEDFNTWRNQVSHPLLLAYRVNQSLLTLLDLLLALCLLAFLHPKNAAVEGVFGLGIDGAASSLVKNDWVCLLLTHLFNFLFLLVFFCLLADLKEVWVEDLMWVQGVRVRIVLFVVRLVHALQFVVSFGYPSDRNALV